MNEWKWENVLVTIGFISLYKESMLINTNSTAITKNVMQELVILTLGQQLKSSLTNHENSTTCSKLKEHSSSKLNQK